jgi:aldose 1-epimerase
MDRICLRAGALRLETVPSKGGIVTGFWSETPAGRVDWFRPDPGGDVLAAACFPLIPYSNRIRDGRFRFRDREIALPLNFGDHPHSIHGHGWQSPWRAAHQTEDTLALDYHHDADAWPYEYEARQEFRLTADRLKITLSVRNLSDADMPAGLGLHPYFPLRANAALTADIEEVWLTDDEVMPTERVAPPPRWDLSLGAELRNMKIDNGFVGWNGVASIAWPEESARLTITASDCLRKLVVFAPPGENYFCVEPVSHVTDAFNMAANGASGTGMRILGPGETLTARVAFSPELHPA